MGWASGIKSKMEQQKSQTNEAVIDTVELFGKLLIENSPTQPDAVHSTGLFKNSWYVSVNEFDPSIGTVPDSSGSGSLARLDELKSVDWFKTRDGFISFTNNLDYAYRVEYLGWPSPTWSGTVGAYAPVRNSVIALKGAVKK